MGYPKFEVTPGEVGATVYAGGTWGGVWCVEIATDASRPRVGVREGFGVWLCHDKHPKGENCCPTKVTWNDQGQPLSFVVHEERDRVYVVGLPTPPGSLGEETVLASTDDKVVRKQVTWEDRATLILGVLAGGTWQDHEAIFGKLHEVYCKDCGGERQLMSDGSRRACHCTNDE